MRHITVTYTTASSTANDIFDDAGRGVNVDWIGENDSRLEVTTRRPDGAIIERFTYPRDRVVRVRETRT